MATNSEDKADDTDDDASYDNNTDDEFTSNSSTLINVNETDFYKLLNINPNATKEEIRKAYFRRAREFHPDKNKNTNTTKLFQSMKLAYETLYDDKRRAEYDVDTDMDATEETDDDGDDLFSTSKSTQKSLIIGEKISDAYRTRIDRYIVEYEHLSFQNNFHVKFREIIEKINNDSNICVGAIDSYVLCSVCRQSCLNKTSHERESREPYERLFDDKIKLVTLEEIIGINLWNWKAVEQSSIYFPIWNAKKEWDEVPALIQRLEHPLRIIFESKRQWTLFIDRYEQNQVELMKLPKHLSQATIINYLPDKDEIKTLKMIFDMYGQEEERGIFSKLQNNDQRTTTGHYCLVDCTTITNKYILKSDFCYPIANPPDEIVSNHCRNCGKSFSFFNRHYYCRMCGHQHCSDCLIFKRIPHLGYIKLPVRICRKCSDEKQTFVYQHIFNYVKFRIEQNYTLHLSEYLALLYLYKPVGNESFYQTTGVHLYKLANYPLALQCFMYANMTSDEYLKYSIEFCLKKEYSYAFTCMSLCQKSNRFWVEQAASQNNSIYALLCYEFAKLTAEQMFDIAIAKSTYDTDTCLFYLLYLHAKYRNKNGINWNELAKKTLLKTTYDGSVAMFCFYLHGTLPVSQWCEIAERLAEIKQFDKLAYLCSYLYYVLRIDLSISSNSYVYFLCKILTSNSTQIPLDDWLNDICKTLTCPMNRFVVGLSICHLYKYSSWIEYRTQYVNEKKYIKALFCHKMAEYTCQNRDLDWLTDAIENFSSLGYELLDGIRSPDDWKELGDQCINKGKYDVALNCFLRCPAVKIDEVIIDRARLSILPLSTALHYYVVVYKRLRKNTTKILSKENPSLCNNTFYDICLVLSKQKNPHITKLIKSAIKTYETVDMFKDISLFKYHLLLLNELKKSNHENNETDRLINGGVHILSAFENLSNTVLTNLIELNRKYLTNLHNQVLERLKAATYNSCVELMEILLNPKNYFVEQLKHLLHQCLGRLQLSEVQPHEYRSKMYLIQAIIFKLENEAEKSLNSAHDALLSHPYDSVMDSLVIYMNHSCFHSTLRQALIDDIKKRSLNLANIDPPTAIMNFTFLKRSERLIMLKKYERAILKRLAENDPVQAAYIFLRQ